MAETDQNANRGMKTWVRVLLVVSLAANMLIIGTVVGAMVTWSKWQSRHPPRLDMASGPLTRALTREDRRVIGRQMREAYRSGSIPHADLRAEIEGLIEDLRAATFDPAAVEQRLTRHRRAFDERFALGQKLLLQHLTQMKPEERAAYADRLQEALEKRSKNRDRKPRTE